MFLTAAACIGLNNIALGFLLGLALVWCPRVRLLRVEDPQERP
jgi:hypothetical protein